MMRALSATTASIAVSSMLTVRDIERTDQSYSASRRELPASQRRGKTTARKKSNECASRQQARC
eukprot:3098941-Pleurochrysis_carterae.AAC.1